MRCIWCRRPFGSRLPPPFSAPLLVLTKAHSDFLNGFFFPCYICPLFSELEPAFLTFWTFVFIHKGNFKNCSGLHFWHLAPQIATIRQEQRSEVHLATASTFHNRIKSRKIGWFSIQAFAQEIKRCMYVFPHTLNFLPVHLKSVCIVFIK